MNIAIILAGGVGIRMHSKDRPKQFLDLFHKPIIIHTLELFENSPEIDAIVVACLQDWIPHLNDLLEKFHVRKVKKVVPGGATAQLSIYNGLCAAKEMAGAEKSMVLIHDGVRPLITPQIISDNVRGVLEHGSAITSAIVKETIVVIDDQNGIDSVPDRAMTRVAKSPQSFWLDDVLEVQRRALADNLTAFIDPCSMMQWYGKKLYLIDGPYDNIKITTPDDYFTVRAILEAHENAQIYEE